MAQWNTAAQARNEFADMMESLTPEQRQQQSLCDAWTAHEVLAHVTSFVETGAGSLFATIIKSGFNFDKAAVAMAAKRSGRSTTDLTASLRANGSKSSPLPMFPEELTVADIAIHTQDVRRGLGLEGSLGETLLRTTLDFQTAHKKADILVKRPPLDGIKLQAADMDWSFGQGAEISGSAEAIMMALAQRPVLDELSGDGLANWR